MLRRICALILCIFLASVIKAGSLKDKSKKEQCRPIEYTLSSMPDVGNDYKVVYRWLYDDQGRLIGDSVYSLSSQAQSPPAVGEYFSYQGDSVFHLTNTGDTAITILTAKGLPASELLPYGLQYKTYYYPNGELKKMEQTRPSINKRGELDSETTTCDSIIYVDGNIVRYRVRYKFPVDTFFWVACHYYEGYEIQSPEFYPFGKITGLSNNPMNQFGCLNVSLFSKNLIRNMECPGASLVFIFRFDKEGKVTGFDRQFIYGYGDGTTAYRDRNEIKYSCK